MPRIHKLELTIDEIEDIYNEGRSQGIDETLAEMRGESRENILKTVHDRLNSTLGGIVWDRRRLINPRSPWPDDDEILEMFDLRGIPIDPDDLD